MKILEIILDADEASLKRYNDDEHEIMIFSETMDNGWKRCWRAASVMSKCNKLGAGGKNNMFRAETSVLGHFVSF